MNKAKDKKLFVSAMVREYKYLNAEFYDGALPAMQFGIVRTRHRAEAWTLENPIKVAMAFYLNPKSHYFTEVMLHEMVHVDQMVNGYEIGHGEYYQEMVDIFLLAGYYIA